MRVIKKLSIVVTLSATVMTVAALWPPSPLLGHGNERGTATARFEGGIVTIEYGRPTLKGRDPLSLIRPGTYWRLGADRATTLTTEVDLTMGDGQRVAAGTYTLLLKFLGDDKWSLIVAKGAAQGSGEPEGLVAEIPMLTHKLDASVEALTIKLSSEENQGSLAIEWASTQMVTDVAAS